MSIRIEYGKELLVEPDCASVQESFPEFPSCGSGASVVDSGVMAIP
jgi:hypothetical protein